MRELLDRLRDFVLAERSAGTIVVSEREITQKLPWLERASQSDPRSSDGLLYRLATEGIVCKVAVTDMWILRPDVLEQYTQQVIRLAGADAKGLGAVLEDDVLAGNFPHDALPRSADEQLMLLMTAREIVGRRAAMRVATAEGQMIVFPDQMRPAPADYPLGLDRETSHRFSGQRTDALTVVTVQLARSAGVADLHRLYRKSAVFRDPCGATFCLGADGDHPGGSDGGGIAVFLGDLASLRCRHKLLLHIEKLLETSTGPGPLVPVWPPPSTPEPDDLPGAPGPDPPAAGAGMHDVFLCHNSRDRDVVRQLRDALAHCGISSWVDSDMVVPGDQPAAEIERVIDQVPAVALVVGAHAMGPWQRQEYYAFLGRISRASDSFPPVRVIPVLIPGASGCVDLPPFARTYNAVDLRANWADGVARLAAAVRLACGGNPSTWIRGSQQPTAAVFADDS